MDFESFQKLARLSRECVITEKIDGTNGVIAIGDNGEFFVGSRSRWITPEDDNHGFARWAFDNRDELLTLGPGRHFGEWWGAGIQRRYGLAEKRFSLFNTHRWSDALGARPACCHVVPVLYTGLFTTRDAEEVLQILAAHGSVASPRFMDPEGIVIYHTAASALFKKTIKGDEEGKHAEAHPPRPKVPRPPKDPSKGGRRIGQFPYEGPDKRRAATARTT
jgi:hypothetical protein